MRLFRARTVKKGGSGHFFEGMRVLENGNVKGREEGFVKFVEHGVLRVDTDIWVGFFYLWVSPGSVLLRMWNQSIF